MKLSILIVSYNVKYFLDQLIESILASQVDFDYEVIVVDNQSKDGSVAHIRNKFPEIEVLANTSNVGFAKANNQAALTAKGEYILLLNPDTLVDENTFQVCIDFLDEHADTGAVGVKMYDGSGSYLPESKRGLPTPWVSMTKILGLNKIFKGSRLFDEYYLGYLNEDELQKVDVLTGAFMMIRKSIFDYVGGLDESYFMYGEDVDISFQIQKRGFDIHYLPSAKIIHYKGESTDKSSFKRNKDFYQSMLLFSRKNLLKDYSWFYNLWISISIYLIGVLSSSVNKIARVAHMIIEGLVFYLGILGVKNAWAFFIYNDMHYYKASFDWFNAPLYVIIWLALLLFVGAYDKYPAWRKVINGSLLGLIVILMAYALLPDNLRSSRPIIFLSFIWVIVSSFMVRTIWSRIFTGQFLPFSIPALRILVFGEQGEIERVKNMYEENPVNNTLFFEVINPEDDENLMAFKLDQTISNNHYDELIICGKQLDFNFIIDLMRKLKSKIKFRLLTEYSSTIVGSHSSRHPGELYALEFSYRIVDPIRKRLKRLVDLSIVFCMILMFPLTLWLMIRKRFSLSDLFGVLFGHKSWVGYDPGDPYIHDLPAIKIGIYHPADLYTQVEKMADTHKINEDYARNYSVLRDLRVIVSKLSTL